MTDDIRVSVASWGPGLYLRMTYRDPTTGKKVVKSAGTRDRREAERAAAVWQDELNSGRYQAPSKLTWADFRKRYEEEKLAALPCESSRKAYGVALDHLQRIVNPDRLAKLTPQVLSRFQAEARKEGMKATTLARHLRHIMAALRWGEKMELLVKAPAIEMPQLPKGQSLAKHRAVTAEEFDRMIAAVPKVRPHDALAWERLLHGLWLTGLRLSEAVALDWNDGPFVLNVTGKRPVFCIEAEGQKSGESEVAPMTPDFAEWILAETPPGKRYGKVFPIIDAKTGSNMAAEGVGRVIGKIGKRAGVMVGKTEKATRKGGKLVWTSGKSFAGAHDLRRAFCTRWSQKVTQTVLQKLARHAHISTTLTYYVTLTANDIGDTLWAAHAAAVTATHPTLGTSCGTSCLKEATNAVVEDSVSDCYRKG